jgi:hypothetical protein
MAIHPVFTELSRLKSATAEAPPLSGRSLAAIIQNPAFPRPCLIETLSNLKINPRQRFHDFWDEVSYSMAVSQTISPNQVSPACVGALEL